MADPNDSETPEAEFKRLSSEIAAAIAGSDEMKAVAVGVLLGTTAAMLAQALANPTDSSLNGRQRAEVADDLAEILAASNAQDAAVRPAPPRGHKPIPWRDAIIQGAASLIELFPEEEEPLSSLPCRCSPLVRRVTRRRPPPKRNWEPTRVRRPPSQSW